MNNVYYKTVDELEKSGVDRDYILGWVGGFLGNPPREEQRATEAYLAGYEDGTQRTTDKAAQYKH